jgi:hypothetical protein
MASDHDRKRIAAELFRTTPPALGFYFRLYDSLIVRNDVYALQIEEPEPAQFPARSITHNDILEAAAVLRRDPTLTLDQASEQLRPPRPPPGTARSIELSRITILASVQAMVMLDPTGPVDRWQPSEPFIDFVSRCFPKLAGLAESAAAKSALENQRSMKAWKLRARFRLSLKGTDNLARHLLLDLSHPDEPALFIFHYTAFLKVQLERLQREGFQKDSEPLASLKRYVYLQSSLSRPPSCCTASHRP